MISIINKSVSLDNNCIFSAPGIISIAHICEVKILILYEAIDLIPSGPEMRRDKKVLSNESLEEVNCNIIALDLNGGILWRVESTTSHYNPWTVIAMDKNKWFATTQDGFEYDIDIQTGKISNGIFMR